MKSFLHILSALAIFMLSQNSFAQCVPDPECEDLGTPGEICPMELPDGRVNEFYQTVITFVVPDSVTFEGLSVGIAGFKVDSLTNMPPGMSWIPDSEMFYGDSVHCIDFSGSPEAAGEFTLGVYITPSVSTPFGPLVLEQIVNDTSVVIRIEGASGINPYPIREFEVMQNTPNPFYGQTRFAFYTPVASHLEFSVYNILGKKVYEERSGFPAGEHFFEYNAESLPAGTYFYRVNNAQGAYTGKFVKTSK